MSEMNFKTYAEEELAFSHITYMLEKKAGKWIHPHRDLKVGSLFLIMEGVYQCQVGQTEWTVKKGQLLYIPPNVFYSSQSCSDTFTYQGIFFHVLEGESLSIPQLYQLKLFEKFKALFHSIGEEIAQKSIGYKHKTNMILHDIFRNLTIERMMTTENFSAYYTLNTAINFMNRNYDKTDISVSELADMCAITPTHFTRLFQKIFSTTPKKYIINLKMTRAVDMLQYSSYSINEIAEQLGFACPAYFSTAFKKHMGMSPLEYRLQYGIMDI